jgi:Concanavalin A-like lectin/glucanases superfamily
VWHLSGGSKDSTTNAFDGKDMIDNSYADAKFARGLVLDGSKHDHIDLKDDIKIVGGAAGCTFSAWINPTKIEDSINGMIIMTIGKWFNDNHNSYTDFNVNAAGQMISHIDPGTNTAASGYARILSDPGFIKPNEWAFVTYVVDLAADEERFFKNGQLVSTKPPPKGKFDAPAFIDMISTRVVIGSEEDNVAHWYTGAMDELRIEKGMRPAEWIAAQYRAMTAAGYVTIERDK